MNPKDRAGAAKPNLSVLPLAPLIETIAALYEGRRKYGPFNWRGEEISETIYADAAIRHLMQFIAGEDLDPDSGVSHVTKAIAGLLVLRDAQLHGCSLDDRLVDQNLGIKEAMALLAGVVEKYPEQAESNLPPRACEAVEPETTAFTADNVGEAVYGHNTDGELLRGEIADWDWKCKYGLNMKVEFGAMYDWYSPDGHVDPNGGTGLPEIVERRAYEPAIEKWSDTPAGDGSYLITPDDIGKRVGLADGSFTTIDDVSPGNGLTFPVRYKAGVLEQSRIDAKTDGSTGRVDSQYAIVRVYHA